MKNYKIIAYLMLSGFLFSCKTSSEKNDTKKNVSNFELDEVPANITRLSEKKFDAIRSKYGNYVKELDRFTEQFDDSIKKRISQYQTYDIDKLIKALQNLKSSYGATGVRIYLGMYPITAGAGSTEDPDNKKVAGMTNLIFVGTKDSVIKHSDGVRGFWRRKDLISRKDGIFAVGEVVGFNEGTLCPPPRNCKGIGATLIDDLP